MHVGVQRSTSESGRRIILDGDELCARGSVCVCVMLCVSLCVCVCQILRENKPKERNGYSQRHCAGLEVGRVSWVCHGRCPHERT